MLHKCSFSCYAINVLCHSVEFNDKKILGSAKKWYIGIFISGFYSRLQIDINKAQFCYGLFCVLS